MENASSTKSAIIDETKNIISKQVSNIDARIARMEVRLKIRENQYRQQLYKMQDLLNIAVLQGNQITTLTNSLADV